MFGQGCELEIRTWGNVVPRGNVVVCGEMCGDAATELRLCCVLRSAGDRLDCQEPGQSQFAHLCRDGLV